MPQTDNRELIERLTISIAIIQRLINKGWVAPDKRQDIIKQGRREIIELFKIRWRGCETNSFTGDSRMSFLLSEDQWQALLKELE